ncbi:sigma factor-like helix-turn-helix DNA-binding protein [Clostridiisalibacter paucivorans]|uniref:sigma factor-like helix-turn-helix DNA-binding protein n=1 Tax=Clostridiisalibacter paucivorans TaxID=408753 RepID=UPI00047CFC1E|nr:sigma factor-like helix-turn-helix DNA-binding protein [Clostridiisalibacter paucivorans]
MDLGTSWLQLYSEYEGTEKNINYFISDLKEREEKDIFDDMNLENVKWMKNNIKDIKVQLKSKILYEMNGISVEDIEKIKLTDQQKKIAILKINHSTKEVAEILNLTPSTIHKTFNRAINKILKYKRDKLNILSPQEKSVYFLYQEGKTRSEIAKELDTTPGSVCNRMYRIRKKLGRLSKTSKIE